MLRFQQLFLVLVRSGVYRRSVSSQQRLIRSLSIVILCFCLRTESHAQAPASVAGATFAIFPSYTTIPGTTYSVVFINDPGTKYTREYAGASKDSGNFSYTRSSGTSATLMLNPSEWQRKYELTFTSSKQGTYAIRDNINLIRETGEFYCGVSSAPLAFRGKVISYFSQWPYFPSPYSYRSFINDKLCLSYDSSNLSYSVDSSPEEYIFSRPNRTSISEDVTLYGDSQYVGRKYHIFTGANGGVSFIFQFGVMTTFYEFDLKNAEPVVITKQPQSKTLTRGEELSLSVEGFGTKPVYPQWYHNGTRIPGATNLDYNSEATVESAGNYSVTFSNLAGVVRSATATVTLVCRYAHEQYRFYPPGGKVDSLNVGPSSCCEWSASTTNDWIHILDTSNHSGSGSFSFEVLTNSTGLDRAGYINIADTTFMVAQYGGTNISFSNSFDPDGNKTNDLLLQNTNGRIAKIAITQSSASIFPMASPLTSAKVVGLADFNDDAQTDVLLHQSDRKIKVRLMSGVNSSSEVTLRNGIASGYGWRIVSAADFTSDGNPDILFQNAAGTLALWEMNGTNFVRSILLRGGRAAGASWKAVGAFDANKDGRPDVLFQGNYGQMAAWIVLAGHFIHAERIFNDAAPGWTATAVCENDIIFRNSTGMLAKWTMNGLLTESSTRLLNGKALPNSWRIAGPK